MQRFFLATIMLLLVGCVAAPPSAAGVSTATPTTPTIVTAVPSSTLSTEAQRPPIGAAPQLNGQALVTALRGGGYIIFLRHTSTDLSTKDRDDGRLLACNKQRTLSEKGRAEAAAIGEAFRALVIPVGRVLSSRYCRTIDTARLAFGDQVTPTDDITGINIVPPLEERRRRIAALRTLMTTPPPEGTNLVLVSHADNLRDVAALEIQVGEAMIFAPTGPAGFTLVGKVGMNDWQALVAQTNS